MAVAPLLTDRLVWGEPRVDDRRDGGLANRGHLRGKTLGVAPPASLPTGSGPVVRLCVAGRYPLLVLWDSAEDGVMGPVSLG